MIHASRRYSNILNNLRRSRGYSRNDVGGMEMNRVSRRLHGWRKRSGIWVKYEPVKCHWVIKN